MASGGLASFLSTRADTSGPMPCEPAKQWRRGRVDHEAGGRVGRKAGEGGVALRPLQLLLNQGFYLCE